ncbi:MAG: ComEC/Rec2 family competence protein, partial [Burkholderiales bacterium]
MRIDILTFVLGVWLLQQQPALPTHAAAGAVLAALAVLLCARSRYKHPGSFVSEVLSKGALLVLGFFWAALLAQARLDDQLPVAWEGKDIEISGVIADLPMQHERGVRFEFDVDQVKTAGAVVPRRLRLNWYRVISRVGYAETNPALHAGERWMFTVRLTRPHGQANPHTFDYEKWLLENGIRATGYVRADARQRLEYFVWRPSYLVQRARELIAARFDVVLGERPYAGVLKALAIGKQSAIEPDQWQIFTRTGVN